MKLITKTVFVAACAPLLASSQCVRSLPPSTADWGPQGWSQSETLAWYTASQGSRLIPQEWFHHLERPDSTEAFLDPSYMDGFRYLRSPLAGMTLPDGPHDKSGCSVDPALPLGFVVDCQPDDGFYVTKLPWKSKRGESEPWVGMNCAACHTATLSYGGKSVRVEGGPTMADFQSFTEALEKALRQTQTEPAKFGRFADGILGPSASQSDRELLLAALKNLNEWNSSLAQLNKTEIPYGYGRLDAIGHIFNKAALLAMPNNPGGQLGNPSDAPVSYPFLWNVTQLNKVEWNGLADNGPHLGGVGIGSLGRNAGEVIGVFGDVTIAKPSDPLGGYVSSIRVDALIEMEQQLKTLQPPKWPADFPPLNKGLVDRGRDVFMQMRCNQCHAVPSATWSQDDGYDVTLVPVFADAPGAKPANIRDRPTNTDIWMACNTALDKAYPGNFKTANAIFGGEETTAPGEVQNVDLVKNAVAGAILNQKGEVLRASLAGLFGFSRELPPPRLSLVLAQDAAEIKAQRLQACMADKQQGDLVYKARPLQGIWATAPYLHNGSVTSLYQLFLPEAKRRQTFQTGTTDFDPKEVGFNPDPSAVGNGFPFDTHLPGNSNAGHDYDTSSMGDDDRWALVEYLKSL